MLKKVVGENKKRNGEIHDENQYLNLIQDIINDGNMEEGRNGKALTVFGAVMHFSLDNNILPLLTTKKVAWKTCLRELLWFISGKTDNKILQDKKVKIWDANASREFLDSRGLQNLDENDLGPIYGHQWRHFNADYTSCHEDYSNKGIDQLEYIINNLKDPTNRNSRRLVMSAWNPCQLDQMALPPCHILTQFNVSEDKYLSCSMYQRSGDIGLGVPFNIASYSILAHLIAHHCNLEVKDFVYYLGNAHIYDDHIDSLITQIQRFPKKFCTLKIINKYENISEYKENDFMIENYDYHDIIKMEMRR